MPQYSDEWGTDVLQSEPEGRYTLGFVSVGSGILRGKRFHPVFFFTICFFFLLSYDPAYDEDLILVSWSLCESSQVLLSPALVYILLLNWVLSH